MSAARCIPFAFAALAALAASAASAAHLSTIYSFCRQTGCPDGSEPHSVMLDTEGDLLGTTRQGGANTAGVVYQLSAPASGHAWHEKDLHDFCSKPNCADGNSSFSQLNPDGQGNFFGATEDGGPDNGVIFELSPSGGKSGWDYRVVYSLCSLAQCADGQTGDGAMVFDTSGNVYGIAVSGGANNKGVVYELSPSTGPGRKSWTEKVLYNFCSAANCTDGANPVSGLTYAGAASGAPYDGTTPLYGTTNTGGAKDNGIVFTLKPMENGNWNETVLHDFCLKSPCSDGATPTTYGAVVVDTSGNVFGTTVRGGKNDSGTIYEVTFRKKWRAETLYDFCSLPDCIDGKGTANMIEGADGKFYGTSSAAVFRLLPAGKHSTYEVLHQFCSEANCADGAQPAGNVVMDPSGTLYGATTEGGAYGEGSVFSIKP